MIVFTNRRGAGQQLARHMTEYRGAARVVVVALCRSAVPIASVVAGSLAAPLRLFSDSAEIGYGGRTVIVIPDGLAGPSRMHSALLRLRKRGAQRLVAAIPVAAEGVVGALAGVADRVICLSTPHEFGETRLWYADFPRVSDEEARAYLGQVAAGEEFESIEQIGAEELHDAEAAADFLDDDEILPGADDVDDIGMVVGMTYQDDEPLRFGEKEQERDQHRWELDPASADDYAERSHDGTSAELLLTMKHAHPEKRR